jgi:hypothetical protein
MCFAFSISIPLAGLPIVTAQSDGDQLCEDGQSVPNDFQAIPVLALGIQTLPGHSFPELDSKAIYGPALSKHTNPLMQMADSSAKPGIFESKERVFVNADIIRVILSQCSDMICINLLSIGDLQRNPELLQKAIETGSSGSSWRELISQADSQPEFSFAGDGVIRFAVGDLFRQTTDMPSVPVHSIDSVGKAQMKTVPLKQLLELISAQVDPVTVEIENFDRCIIAPISKRNGASENNQSPKPTINFSFDLRNFIRVMIAEPENSKSIEGVLTVKEAKRSAANGSEMKTSLNQTVTSKPNETSIKFNAVELESDLKPKPRISQKVYARRHAQTVGKFEMAVAPDQYGSKKIRIQQVLFDIRENGNIQLAKIDEIKAVLLKAIDKNVKTIRLRLEPEELGSLDIKLNLGSDGVSILLKAENADASRILDSHLPELKNGLEGANVKVLELLISND